MFPALYSLFPRVNHIERLLFTKHLAIMIKSGISILDALDTLREETKSKTFQKILAQIFSDTKNGQALSVSLKKFPDVFDQFYISLIEIGETSGTLEQNLEFLSVQLSKDYQLRKKIQGALMYPGLVLSATVIMGGFIAFFILPKLVDFFSAFQVELPLSTKILLWIAVTMKVYGILIIGGLGLLSIGTVALIQIPSVKFVWHTMILKMPIFGQLLLYQELARFSRNFGILLKSGIPSNKGLEITANTLSNMLFQKDVRTLAKKLAGGNSIGSTLKKEHFQEFPGIVEKMIRVGEKTGKLEEVLLYLGDYYEDEIDSISKNLSTLLEPFLLVTIGLAVGFVALAIISPIYELTGSISK
jgi:type IV pilus assembly protein PilC